MSAAGGLFRHPRACCPCLFAHQHPRLAHPRHVGSPLDLHIGAGAHGGNRCTGGMGRTRGRLDGGNGEERGAHLRARLLLEGCSVFSLRTDTLLLSAHTGYLVHLL